MNVSWDDLLRPGNARSFFARDPLPTFDPLRGTYSAANAWWLAEFSRIVYRRDGKEAATPLQPLRSEFLRRVGLEEVELFRSEITGTSALLMRSSQPMDYAVLAFRGTEQKIQDLLHDADTWPVAAFGGTALVHRGFKRALNSVWTPIEAALAKLQCPVFYTGHSLGAALATLAAVRRAPVAVYAFGSPRVGDVRLVEKLKAVPIHRIVHGSDVVTTVPPEALGFRHVGEEHRIGNVVRPAVFDRAAIWNTLTTPVSVLADHAPINYVSCIMGMDLSNT